MSQEFTEIYARHTVMDSPGSQNAQDVRVERLWRKLDVRKKGELDFKDLQLGLRQLDHRKDTRRINAEN